jgi:stage III sporulation protein AE
MLLLLGNLTEAAAETVKDGELTEQILAALSIDKVNQFIVKVNEELGADIPELNTATIKSIAAKGIKLDWSNVKETFLSLFCRELVINSQLMGKLIFLAVLCALLKNIQTSFENEGITLLANSVCYVLMTVVALDAFYNAMSIAKGAVGYMVGFMEALLPVLISLLAGVGAVTSAAILSPLLLFIVTTISTLVKDVVLPLLFLAAVLQCVNFLSDKYKVANLAGLFRQAGMVILGLSMMVFIGFITVQGVAGSVADGITLRTAKYATSTFVPVVGKIFADTVELVMGASLLVKNAVGLFGIAAVIAICLMPLIKLLSLIVIMKVAGALIQPMGDEKMATCLESLGDNLLLVFGGVLTVALMFFLTITMIIGVGSVAMMLR